ncbi:phosphoglycerate mutase-like protein [Cutaneotrichosporon oleaginosum]|uniref:Phosphoglycerate mutase-like protein n=1 Tax=Cutaneotrichosporon oleaginosum TaxID=879819 RepID=A0A0J0XPN7_9TREE|nr:phosphoglycerate mutase-like protein [Cutaneotrichosporon oleaginosum]KLT43091.1 phosphoglycerate mutase-like protein [Cutaneotrichosporon oleaginosum]TXT10021.1 hypothetical protein COLE_03955 [Cutaneotrichosporon oleaginosum]
MLIYFCRHGQTEFNAQGIIQGNINVHLNEQGQMEAALLAEALKSVPFTEARSSHLTRAFETAQAVVSQHPGLELVADPGLRERQLGSLEGKRWTPKDGIPPDAEQSGAFRARVKEWAEGFFADHVPTGPTDPSTPEPIVLAVSHGAYISALLGALLSPPFSFSVAPGVDTHKPCLNTSQMKVRATYDAQKKRWKGEILSWANVDHMGGREQRIGVSDDIREEFRKAMGMGVNIEKAGEGAEEKATEEEEAHPRSKGVRIKAS